MKEPFNHTFAVCAYQQSPYLKDCLYSLVRQSVKPNIIVCTSTPNKHIEELAAEYNLPVFINPGPGTMTDNWNFAYATAQTDYVTIVHQDDVYEDEYLERTAAAVRKAGEETSLVHTGWRPRTDEGVQRSNRCTLAQNFLNFPIRAFQRSRRVRKVMLSFGNIIKTPSVIFHKKRLGGGPLFSAEYKFAADWVCFLKLAAKEGKFVHVKKPLLQYRVHTQAITTTSTACGVREKEDKTIFESMWPKPLAKVVYWFYKYSYNACR